MKNNELDDIKRTLQRIQRIASEPIDEADLALKPAARAAGARANGAPAREQSSPRANISAPVTEAPRRSRIELQLVLAAVGVLAVIGVVGVMSGVLVDFGGKPDNKLVETAMPRPEPQERLPSPVLGGEPSPVMTDAQSLLDAGRVVEARRTLTGAPVTTPEVALILARSYDPNYLRQIPNADAAPDPQEAERWYRKWRDIAAEKGLVLEPERFDRIIRAMH
jgi:hypothetical protein